MSGAENWLGELGLVFLCTLLLIACSSPRELQFRPASRP